MGIACGEVWRLARGDEVLGEIVIDNGDFPWVSGRFLPQPAFDDVAPLFAEELALLEAVADDDGEAWERAYDRIAHTLSLVSPRGPVPEFLLHIKEGEAWFRWSDEPFDAQD